MSCDFGAVTLGPGAVWCVARIDTPNEPLPACATDGTVALVVAPGHAAQVVRRVYTDLAVIDVTDDGFVVREMVEDIDFDGLQAKTEAKLHRAPDLKPLKAPAL